MIILKRKSALAIAIIVFLLSQHQLFAGDDFNEFATRIFKKDIKGVRELIDKGADVNVREKTMGSTPLILACSRSGSYEIVKLLIANGADVNIEGSHDGRTALMWAARESQNTVELLLANGADVNVKGVDGMTAFIQSIFGILSDSVTTDVCDLLLAKGSDVNARLIGPDAAGWTALMFATSNGKLDLVKYLISKKANVNLKAKDGTTALSLSIKDKRSDIADVLKADGAKE